MSIKYRLFDEKMRPQSSYEAMEARIKFLEGVIERLTRVLRQRQAREATEHGTYRMKGLKTGEVAIYTDEGDSIVLKRGRLIEVTTQTLRINTQVMEVNASSKIDLNTPMVTCSQQATVQQRLTGNGGLTITNASGTGGSSSFVGSVSQTGGSFTSDTDVVANGISLHGHHHNGTQPGSGNTGTPV